MARLHTTCQEQQSALQRLAQQEAQLLAERDRLQHRIKDLVHQCATLQHQQTALTTHAAPEGTTLRELRKLRYEVEKLHTCIAAKDVELQRQHAMLASYKALRSTSATTVPPAVPPSSLSLPLQTLHGKTVALIGAMDKVASHYEHVIQELGGGCLRHDGDMRQGQKGLVDVIKRADIILCPVDCNSHGAVTCTKKVCRTL
jgi:chromosome segregation ATPase